MGHGRHGKLHRDDDEPRKMEYSLRSSSDFIVSGPIYPAKGPGRAFLKPEYALKWATGFYGAGRVQLLPESLKGGVGRWAILVKKASS